MKYNSFIKDATPIEEGDLEYQGVLESTKLYKAYGCTVFEEKDEAIQWNASVAIAEGTAEEVSPWRVVVDRQQMLLMHG